MTQMRKRNAFSLVELVIVVVIIGIIAAIAVPRISRGAKGADEAALRGDLSAVRNAIDLYAAEHGGDFPAAKAAGAAAAAFTEDAFRAQVSKYSDIQGGVVDLKDTTHLYGPYLRRPMPPLPVGVNRGSVTIKVVNTGPTVDVAGGFGWIYNYLTGEIIANADSDDDSGSTTYDQY